MVRVEPSIRQTCNTMLFEDGLPNTTVKLPLSTILVSPKDGESFFIVVLHLPSIPGGGSAYNEVSPPHMGTPVCNAMGKALSNVRSLPWGQVMLHIMPFPSRPYAEVHTCTIHVYHKDFHG